MVARQSRWRGAAVALLMAGGVAAAAPATAECRDPLPPVVAGGPRRAITAADLVELRDIGQPDSSILLPESPLAVSPDGRRIAFVINRADVARNSYCRALVVMPVAADARPMVLDSGGELITPSFVRRGLVEHTGYPELVVPAWSPDGHWLAYLRRDAGLTRLWRVRADGNSAAPVSRSPVDVESFAWSPSGGTLHFLTRPGALKQRRAHAEEGRVGFLYDDRFIPNRSWAPQLRGPIPPSVLSVHLASGRIRPATASARRRLSGTDLRYVDRSTSAVSRSGWHAEAMLSAESPLSPLRLHVTDPDGRVVACRADACTGAITGLWWRGDRDELLFLRREGWARGTMALYRWAPGTSAPRAVLRTGGLLLGCAVAAERLVCLSEDATTPRRLISLDPDSGRTTLLFDPNPEFARIRLGQVRRLEWRNALGLEARGDLVLPPDYRRGDRPPLVVVQYRSNGFLRGGTGDEYPIHLLAARGFAVLSFERPAEYASLVPGIRSFDDVNAANAKGWADRNNVLSALETGVRRVIGLGLADPRRLGITGLSDGATTARFAMLNTDLFAAAAISTCCIDPLTVMAYGGPAWATELKAEGYPPATKADPAFWRPVSLAVNAARVDTPLLMQLADSEYLLGLETYAALKEQGKPVELHVFPDEHHYKWQPAHRLAIYQRNLDWFDFWLRGKTDPDPAKAGQYRRWAAMRDRPASGR